MDHSEPGTDETTRLTVTENNKNETLDSELGLQFHPFVYTETGNVLYLLISVFTLGIFAIVCNKYPTFAATIRFQKGDFQNATHVLITGTRESGYEAKVKFVDGIRYFEYKKQRFVYRDHCWAFVLQNAVLTKTPAQVHQLRYGKTSEDAYHQSKLTGKNQILIDDIPVLQMLVSKCTEAFYIFQMASVSIWLYLGYTTYAILILVMSVSSVSWEVYQAKVNEIQLRSLTKYEADFFVLRDGTPHRVASEDLVIGDAVLLDSLTLLPDTKLPCDMLLVQGECVVDESSLTGETVPILKIPLPRNGEGDQKVDGERNKVNMLFGGSVIKQLKPKDDSFRLPESTESTRVLKTSASRESIDEYKNVLIEMDQLPTTKGSVIAIVHSTGFSTAKGQLFRSILFPSEIEFKYAKDSMKFLAILGLIAVIAALNRIIDSVRGGQTVINAILSSLDLITIAVPPALPLILTVGVGFSLQRLKQLMIYCINPERLNYAGRLDTMCWDKTGTITVSKLLFDGVHKHPDCTRPLDFSEENVMANPSSLERLMTVCHGVTRSGEQLHGHSLDLESFDQTGWELSYTHPETIRYQGFTLNVNAVVHPPKSAHCPIYVIQRFEFDAHLQRSSAIAFSPNDPFPVIFTKGSPEAIKQICTPSSIPDDYDDLCSQNSIEGFYVIACATRICSNTDLMNIANQKRSQVERDLTFIGFLLFRNPLKPKAKETFQQLIQASIKSIIITGDNALTAIHVARQLELCNSTFLIEKVKDKLQVVPVRAERSDIHMSATPSAGNKIAIADVFQVLDQHIGSELCITGSALNTLIQEDIEFLNKLMPHVRIFARTKPNDKMWIVEWLIRNGSYVGMCGDGTNDCSALKAAHVGLALSSAEASIVAPFTSAQKRIEDIVQVVREGRCALETSFIGFKYMTLYPLIQLMMSATMNHFGGALSNNQFLFDDMCIVTVLALFTLYTKPKIALSPSRPTDNLFSIEIIMSILGQLGFCVVFFLLNVFLTISQPWFCSIKNATEFLDDSYNPIDPSRGVLNYPCYPYIPLI